MQDTNQQSASDSPRLGTSVSEDVFSPNYLRLESRQLLSATFLTIGTSELVLDDFDAGQDLSFSQGTVDVNSTSQDSYIFRLASGSWTGDASHPLIEIENFAGGINNQLEVATSFFMNSPANAQLTIDGATTSGGMVEFDQTSANLQFGSLQLSNFANDNRSFILSAQGDVSIENVTVFDSDPNDAIAAAATYTVNIDGPLQLSGTNGNLIDNSSADVTLLSQDSITMDGNSTLQATSGPVFMATIGGGDISLASVSAGASGDAVSIVSGGDVLDVRTPPGNNISATAGRIEIVAGGGIGSSGAGAIDVNSLGLQFTSQDAAYFESTEKLTVDDTSSSFGGGIVAGEIDILADVTTGDSFDFVTTASSGAGDFLIDNSADLRLDSASDAEIRIEAINDVAIANGQILTTGGGQHRVSILSTGPDGTLTNSAGISPSISTNQLNINVGSGVGTSGTPLRTSVDVLTANVRTTGDLFLAETDNIELAQVATADGAVDVVAGGRIVATDVAANETEAVEDNADTLSLRSTVADILLGKVFAADDMNVEAATNIQQEVGSSVVGQADASFAAADAIRLANSPTESIDVQVHSQFSANTIEIGNDGLTAGDAAAINVEFGSVEMTATQAILIEDDSTLLAGNTNVDTLYAESGGELTNAANSTLTSTDAQLQASDDIVLGAATNDQVAIGSVGLVAPNVHLEVDSDLEINGQKPVLPGTPAIGQPLVQGTLVEQTLYIVADGSVEQSIGDLCAKRLGIDASAHVHLSSISSTNEAIAISAGNSAAISDSSINSTLQKLEAVPNSDVDASRLHSIAFSHRGDANIETVASPHNSDTTIGLSADQGSVAAFADQSIDIRQNIAAASGVVDPQVTLWSAAGNSDDPAIEFSGGQIFVNGPTNTGIVNANQTFANLFDQDGFVFEGTTKILSLNPDGTASQDIILEYGHPGETGYRVGIVWDALNNFGSPTEDINLFVPSTDLDSEAYNDPIYQNNTVTRHLIAGNEGGRETFSKIDPFSKEAIIAHTDQPKVFADITIRNDQHINLFSGALDSVDNSLNENEQRLLLAELDAPKRAAPILPTISEVEPLTVKQNVDIPFDSPTPLEQTTSLFSRQIAPFEKGELQWVQVAIPLDDLEMAGDEVLLKHPARFYPASEAAEEHDFENVGENETDRIVKQIEGSSEAEPGYWYRIFKAYDNRDDELIFYYFKTGEAQIEETDSGDGIEPSSQEFEASPTENVPDAAPIPTRPQSPADPEFKNPPSVDTPAPTQSSLVLLALMGFKATKKSSTKTPDDGNHHEDTEDSKPKFDRRSRFLRKLRSTG